MQNEKMFALPAMFAFFCMGNIKGKNMWKIVFEFSTAKIQIEQRMEKNNF